MTQRDPFADERAEALQEFIDSATWRTIMRPTLERRSADLAAEIAGRRHATIEQIRWLQAEWATLQLILDDTKRFLGEE